MILFMVRMSPVAVIYRINRVWRRSPLIFCVFNLELNSNFNCATQRNYKAVLVKQHVHQVQLAKTTRYLFRLLRLNCRMQE